MTRDKRKGGPSE